MDLRARHDADCRLGCQANVFAQAASYAGVVNDVHTAERVEGHGVVRKWAGVPTCLAGDGWLLPGKAQVAVDGGNTHADFRPPRQVCQCFWRARHSAPHVRLALAQIAGLVAGHQVGCPDGQSSITAAMAEDRMNSRRVVDIADSFLQLCTEIAIHGPGAQNSGHGINLFGQQRVGRVHTRTFNQDADAFVLIDGKRRNALDSFHGLDHLAPARNVHPRQHAPARRPSTRAVLPVP